MKLFYYIQDTFKKTMGLLLIIPGALLCIIGIAGLAGEIQKNDSQGIAIGYGVIAFSVAVIVPGILVYRSGQKQAREEMKVRQLASLLSTYRRMTISELGRKLGVPESEAEILLTLAIDKEIISGHIDRATGEFFISGSSENIREISKCPFCGAPVSQVFHADETARCQNCGNLFR